MTDNVVGADIDLRQLAERLTASAAVRDVCLVQTHAVVHSVPEPGQGLTYDIEFEPTVEADASMSAVLVQVARRLLIEGYTSPGETADSDVAAVTDDDADNEHEAASKEVVASADFGYATLFDCELPSEAEDLDDNELAAFAITTGQIVLHPYIREYVHDLTGRLALPPLTLEPLV